MIKFNKNGIDFEYPNWRKLNMEIKLSNGKSTDGTEVPREKNLMHLDYILYDEYDNDGNKLNEVQKYATKEQIADYAHQESTKDKH